MKRYNIINNSLGWLMFIIAAVTYLLTVEPTASFWDCPEFIAQAYKLEIGHPPGNPIFMLAGRFFVNFASGPEQVALAVNCMSALLSAATILLLFWTITHLVRRLTVDDKATSVSLVQSLVIFGSGICGSLAYTWSDTFWFSAVEGEVYAFSSFCTALVFWLILKWENRADLPHSDRYLVLIAYVIGISIAVHLLNLLCIPAIVLVFYYRKWANPDARGSLIALGVSVIIVGLILYGLVPGFIEIAQYFELLCVNVLHMGYNTGTLIYTVLLLAVIIWAMRELYLQRDAMRIKLSLFLTILLSGMLFIGDSLWVAIVLIAAVAYYIFKRMKTVNVRVLNVVVQSIFVIFIGYSSYALLLIRSTADTPMNQNAPDNVFALSSYLNREQYGDRPLFYGQTFNAGIVYQIDAQGRPQAIKKTGKAIYGKSVKTSPDQPDHYEITGYKTDYEMNPELNMLFPRMYDSRSASAYREWTGMKGEPVQVYPYRNTDGSIYQGGVKSVIKPTFLENLRFFFNYQLNHMYWRYFLWNFAGRQNDIQGNGEVTHGNWISGIPVIDNARLGDQSLLPYDLGEGNKGHNVYFMLPLILGIIGLLWQSFTSKRGIEQFWVVAFLFFMTGIAIVLYLNQTPNQPRERDYAFAGSFYAFAIWIGMGVAGLWRLILAAAKNKRDDSGLSKAGAVIAVIIGIIVPLQMVSQTWDDHDRSGRYTTRDFGMNYLASVDENAIIFTNGDNDTFPLWYAQEVEGYRTDVRVVNLSYLTTDWYVNQQRMPSYDAAAIDMQAKPEFYAHDKRQFSYFLNPDTTEINALSALKNIYMSDPKDNAWGLPEVKYPNMYIPLDTAALIKSGRITPDEAIAVDDAIHANQTDNPDGGLRLSSLIALDMLATSAANGWNRPVYFAMTVPEDYYLNIPQYLRSTGMAYEVSPINTPFDGYNFAVNTDKAYDNIVNRFRWGGLDIVEGPEDIYLDETVRRMVNTTRTTMINLATALYNEGVQADEWATLYELDDSTRKAMADFAKDRFERTQTIMDLMREKLPENIVGYSVGLGTQTSDLYQRLEEVNPDRGNIDIARQILLDDIRLYAGYVKYFQTLTPAQFSTLTRTDRYIYDTYFINLLRQYMAAGGDAQALMKELQDEGVNFSRYFQSQAPAETGMRTQHSDVISQPGDDGE